MTTSPMAVSAMPQQSPDRMFTLSSLHSPATPLAVHNRHIPICSPGSAPVNDGQLGIGTCFETSSLLHPPTLFSRFPGPIPLYSIDANQLAAALRHAAQQPLASPQSVFPWMHGLHGDNGMQLAFFFTRKRTLKCQPHLRAITLVKAGLDLSRARLKGSILAEELLDLSRLGNLEGKFIDIDPREGFSVRNFDIQTAKLATLSDIVIYGDETTPREMVINLAERLSKAQQAWREKFSTKKNKVLEYNTFVLSDSFTTVESNFPEMVSVKEDGTFTGHTHDLSRAERLEMYQMSTATQIGPNVWVGPTPDAVCEHMISGIDIQGSKLPYDLLVECNEQAQLPQSNEFTQIDEILKRNNETVTTTPQLGFPASGSLLVSKFTSTMIERFVEVLRRVHAYSNSAPPTITKDGEVEVPRKRKDSRIDMTDDDVIQDFTNDTYSISTTTRRILVHCADGYTETSLFIIAYYMFANFVPLHQAYIDLHKIHKRNFFAYPSDVAVLRFLENYILHASPVLTLSTSQNHLDLVLATPPRWSEGLDGSLPSRILNYMYLGNLSHANNPGLLKEIGIGQVLSVGEPISWSREEKAAFCGDERWEDKCLFIDGIQDNGVDELTGEFEKCLDFIHRGRERNTATLVHCRVGVSRSATICIAEVMHEKQLSFPKAYCFVRARRLNVIIQPHLRFAYELLKYEEHLAKQRGVVDYEREMEWATIAREIANMNKPYLRK